MKVAHVGASGVVLVDGTGSWSPGSGAIADTPLLTCAGAPPPTDAACRALGATMRVTNLWATGYMAHMSIARWQKGAALDLSLGRARTQARKL